MCGNKSTPCTPTPPTIGWAYKVLSAQGAIYVVAQVGGNLGMLKPFKVAVAEPSGWWLHM